MRHLFHEFALAAFAVAVVARPAAVAGQDTAATAGPAVKVLAGDPDKPGPSTVRITFPAGFHTDPHHHGVDLTATVRSGMLFMGWNTRFDTTLVVAFPPGSRTLISAGKDHFDWFPDGAEVEYASDNLPIAVRGGGHNIAGKALCDDGLVIDPSPMKEKIAPV